MGVRGSSHNRLTGTRRMSRGQPGRRRSVNKTAGSATHGWFGLSPGQLLWFVAIRVIVAAIVGAVVYVVTGSVLWLIVALFVTGVVINSAANTQHRR
jgi:hypothetical protein